jgi:CBS domain containing-hemolysin-like protein
VFEKALHGMIEVPEAVLHTAGFVVALSIVVCLHLVVGEMAPKSWAIAHPERSALALARPFRGFTLAFKPVISFLNAAANAIVRLCGVEPQDELAVAHSPADLRSPSAPEPPVADPAAVAHAAGRSRLVVHGGDLDDMVGVVHVKGILLIDNGERAATVGDMLRPAVFTSEDRPPEDVLVDMRTARQHLAIVGRPGAVVGIVAVINWLGLPAGDDLRWTVGDVAVEVKMAGGVAALTHRAMAAASR